MPFRQTPLHLSLRRTMTLFYDSQQPKLPTDDPGFLSVETAKLFKKLQALSKETKEPFSLPSIQQNAPLLELQAYEQRLRKEIKRIREIQFYYAQSSGKSLQEIGDTLED